MAIYNPPKPYVNKYDKITSSLDFLGNTLSLGAGISSAFNGNKNILSNITNNGTSEGSTNKSSTSSNNNSEESSTTNNNSIISKGLGLNSITGLGIAGSAVNLLSSKFKESDQINSLGRQEGIAKYNRNYNLQESIQNSMYENQTRGIYNAPQVGIRQSVNRIGTLLEGTKPLPNYAQNNSMQELENSTGLNQQRLI